MNTPELSTTKLVKNTKFSQLRKLLQRTSKPKLLLYGSAVFLFLITVLGLIASSLLVREQQDQRSQASEPGVTVAQISFNPFFARTSNTEIFDVPVKMATGRPMTGASFAVRYNAAEVEVTDFVMNPQYASAFRVDKQIDSAQGRGLFVLTQTAPNDGVTMSNADVGVLKVRAKTPFSGSNGLSLLSFLPQRTDGSHLPNQAVVLNMNNEIISLNPANSFGVVAGAPYGGITIPQSKMSYRMSLAEEWTDITGQNFQFRENMFVRLAIRKDQTNPSLAVMPQGATFQPGFWIRVVESNGTTVRATKVAQGRPGQVDHNYVQDVKIMKVNGQMVVAVLDGNSNPIPNETIPFNPGDYLDSRVNAKIMYNSAGLEFGCTQENKLIINPIGNPSAQQQLGSCTNNSARTARWDAGVVPPTATPTTGTVPPTATPTTGTVPPTATPTTTAAGPTPFIPKLQVNHRMGSEAWTTVPATQQTFAFVDGMTLRVSLNRASSPSVLPVLSSLPAGTVERPAYRLRVFDANNVQRGDVLVRQGIIGTGSGNFIQDFKVATVNGQRVLQVLDMATGLPVSGQQLAFNVGDTFDVRMNFHWVLNGQSRTCKEDNNVVENPDGRPELQQVVGTCANQSRTSLRWAQ